MVDGKAAKALKYPWKINQNHSNVNKSTTKMKFLPYLNVHEIQEARNICFCCIVLDFTDLPLLNRIVLEWFENLKRFWKQKADIGETTLLIASSLT